jgi:hypothetical protein
MAQTGTGNLVGLLWTSDQPVAKAQHRNTTNIHVLGGIRTHDLSVKAIKAYDSDHSAAGTDIVRY